MYADPDMVRYTTGAPVEADEAWRALASFTGSWILRGYGNWSAIDRESGEYIGRIGLWNPVGWPGTEVGWWVRRKFWGRGYATEAATAARDFAFEQIGFDRLISVIHPENAPSIRVAEKLGMTFLRVDKVRGVTVDLYVVAREEWLSLK